MPSYTYRRREAGPNATEQFAPEPRHNLFDLAEARGLIHQIKPNAQGRSDGDDDLPICDSTTIEQDQRIAAIQYLCRTGSSRALRIINQAKLETIRQLRDDAPNFATFLDLVVARGALSQATGTGFCLPPVLLLGPPGVGKTHVARKLAATLALPLSYSSANAGIELKIAMMGLSTSWRQSRMGEIGRHLGYSAIANPLFVLDEIDKAAIVATVGAHPLDFLHSLLEPENARCFKDEFLELSMDASKCSWIMTANSTSNIPASLLDRMIVIEIAAPERAALHKIVRQIFAGVNIQLGDHFEALSNEVVETLATETPRTARKTLELSAAFAVTRGASRRNITIDDVRRAQKLVGQPASPRRIGF